jgi:cytochrome c-type biogenesis protein CcmE
MRPRTRVLLLVGVVAVGGLLAFAGARPQGFLSVAAVTAQPMAYEGRELQLKGTVIEGTFDRSATAPAFLLSDGQGTIEVRWDPSRPIPDHEAGGTIEGKNVVVKGTLARDANGLHLLATEMQVGCASKYRAA